MKNVGMRPIFDRLIDEDLEEPFETVSKKYFSVDDLKSSIMKDISLLLNTRLAPFWSNYAGTPALPYSYGANITAPNSVETTFEIQALENKVKNVITQFESRLTNVKIHFVSLGASPGRALIQIDADVITSERRIPLTFPIVLDI